MFSDFDCTYLFEDLMHKLCHTKFTLLRQDDEFNIDIFYNFEQQHGSGSMPLYKFFLGP